MMDPLVVVSKIQKMMRDNLQRVGDAMISGGVDNMEKYQYMLGQARTYQYLLQEISSLLVLLFSYFSFQYFALSNCLIL